MPASVCPEHENGCRFSFKRVGGTLNGYSGDLRCWRSFLWASNIRFGHSQDKVRCWLNHSGINRDHIALVTICNRTPVELDTPRCFADLLGCSIGLGTRVGREVLAYL